MKFCTLLKSLIRAELTVPIKNQKKLRVPNKLYEFGEKNKNKTFYIIKKDFNPNGLFSNLTFVLDHINFSIKKKTIPVIDMENYLTVYNEREKIFGTRNSWNYYFLPINEYKLNEVYQSKKVLFSKNERINNQFINENLEYKKILIKYIKIKPQIIKLFKKIRLSYFKNQKSIMGVHVRGTLQRIVTKHSLPPNPKDFLNECIKIFKKTNSKKIFLVTEDELYLNEFKKYFKKNLIYLNVPRSNPKFYGSHNLHFTNNSRRYHKFKLGLETLIDCLLLSETKYNIFTDSNVWRLSSLFSKKKQINHQFVTKINSNFKFIARWKWYLHYYFPIIFGKVKYNIRKIK